MCAGNIEILLIRENCTHLEMVSRGRGGVVYCKCFLGMYGQLGHGNQEKQATPTLVYALTDKVVYLVGCGTSHTVRHFLPPSLPPLIPLSLLLGCCLC